MSKIDPKMLTKEMLAKAAACETPEALIALAKENGVELSVEDAKGCLEKLEDFNVDIADDDMAKAAGGACWDICQRTWCL